MISYTSLCVPSSANNYSLAIDYIQKWFLSKFSNGYFKNVHIDGKHVFDDARKFNRTEILKRLKPNVVFQPQIAFDYDRDKVDSYMGDIHTYIQRSLAEESFFNDTDNGIYIGVRLEQIQMNFAIKIRVSSKAQQMDVYKYMQLAFRVGYTQKEYLDLDFHIPYSLMLQIANDKGFEIKNDHIVNPIEFTNYLNSKSMIPILYKFRTINGKTEFFLRMKDLYTHISTQEQPSLDDGEKEGMIYSNYIIDFPITLKIPAPKFYMYMSPKQHDSLINIEEQESPALGIFNTVVTDQIPEVNEKGWRQYLSTEYYDEDSLNKTLTIDFKELFNESDLLKVIRYNNSIGISSSIFINIKIFNDGELKGTMNWETLVFESIDITKKELSNIIIYLDLEYMNKIILSLKK